MGGVRTATLAFVLAWVVSMGAAWAQDVPPLEYTTNSPLLAGSDSPRLEIRCAEPLDSVELSLSSHGARQHFSLGAIERGAPAEVAFESPPGTQTWHAQLSGHWSEGAFELSFDFDFEVSEGLAVNVPLDRVDLAARQLVLTLDRPADRVTYRVIGDDGSELGNGEVSFHGEPAGTALPVSWQQTEGTVLRIDLVAYSTDGFWAELQLVPWSLNIPHEEVNFASGSDVIEPSEAPKIDAAYALLQEAVARYGDLVQVQLYIAGYTDTVGSSADNQRLSEQRARSIAQAFRARGFDAPIFYQGFGESVLEVATPDSTDEARNRRALYVLAAQPPLLSDQIPRADWRPID